LIAKKTAQGFIQQELIFREAEIHLLSFSLPESSGSPGTEPGLLF
jgi:hypothetical protein